MCGSTGPWEQAPPCAWTRDSPCKGGKVNPLRPSWCCIRHSKIYCWASETPLLTATIVCRILIAIFINICSLCVLSNHVLYYVNELLGALCPTNTGVILAGPISLFSGILRVWWLRGLLVCVGVFTYSLLKQMS